MSNFSSSMIPDVFFFEAFDEERDAIERAMPSSFTARFDPRTIQACCLGRPPARIVSIRTQSVIPGSWLAGVDAIVSRTTGHDHVRHLLDQRSPAVACLPEYCTRAVAEQAAMLWMALLRRLPRQQGQWTTFDRDGLTGRECEGRALVVVGVGRIGYQIARIGRGLGMRVIGVDTVRRHADVDYLPWDQAAPHAGVVAASMDLNDGNRGYFNRARLSLLPADAIFVNVARGELVATADLLALLDESRLGGIALDVFEDEPILADALRGLAAMGPLAESLRRISSDPRVILTPHNAFNTREAVERKARFTVEQIHSFLRDGAFRWPISAAEAL